MTHGVTTGKKQKNNLNENDNESLQLPIPPDGGWVAWGVVFASFAIHIVTDGMTYSFGIFYVEFLEYFKEGKGYTAWIASILVGTTLCSGPISSSFVNRYGCRPVTIAGAFLAGTCLILSVFANSVFVLFITVGLGAGMGFGLIYLPAIVSVTMYFEKLRSLATGIAVCGSGFGTFIFAPLTKFLIDYYGWRGAMLIISAIVFNCAVFGALFRPLESPKQSKQNESEKLSDEKSKKIENNNNNDRLLENKSQLQLDSINEKRKKISQHSLMTSSPAIAEEFLSRSQSIGHSYKNGDGNGNGDTNHNKKNGNYVNNDDEGAIRMATSTPLLATAFSTTAATITNENAECKLLRRSHSGSMYRRDALYQGSVHNLPSYSRTSLHEGTLRRTNTLTKASSAVIIDEEKETVCGCIPCSAEAKDTFTEMMNFELLKDPIFVIFTISNFLTSIGFNIPYVYIAAQAEFLQLENSSYLLAIIGIANTIGRIILGYLSDKTWVNRLWVYNSCLAICGVATILSIFCADFYSLGAYAATFGFTIGAYVGLTSVILVDLLGLDKLTNAFGLLLLFQGIASFLGPPLAGWLYDITLTYNAGFLLAGITIALSGIILFSIPSMEKCLERKNNAQINNSQVEGHLMVSL
uniref:Putative monocarboxylate transporter 1 n=1 Tax=Corethrella appendiculata TaxID=1370023 RepID=U5EMP4_9DIPT